MQLSTILVGATLGALASAELTYTIKKAARPSADQQDAYERIALAMDAAIERHSSLSSQATKVLTVEYNTGVATADGSTSGNIRFGADRQFMTERTALHEISHTLGVGLTAAFDSNCASKKWPTALALLRTFDGPNASITCGGDHFWPYGLNYETEMSDQAADRHVEIINAMLDDGIGE